MGVDITIVMGFGYVINIADIGKDASYEFARITDDDIYCDAQDEYGNSDKDACIFIGLKKQVTTLKQSKAGWTPMSFLHDQIYRGNDEIIGGARKYFAVVIDSNDVPNDTIEEYERELKKAIPKELHGFLSRGKFDRWLFSFYS